MPVKHFDADELDVLISALWEIGEVEQLGFEFRAFRQNVRGRAMACIERGNNTMFTFTAREGVVEIPRVHISQLGDDPQAVADAVTSIFATLPKDTEIYFAIFGDCDMGAMAVTPGESIPDDAQSTSPFDPYEDDLQR